MFRLLHIHLLSPDPKKTAQWYVDDIAGRMARLEAQGVEVLLHITQIFTGSRVSHVKGPDNVRIELVQPAG